LWSYFVLIIIDSPAYSPPGRGVDRTSLLGQFSNMNHKSLGSLSYL
jgi:hypothetical protein